MQYREQAYAILQDAERRLRGIVESAAAKGEYHAVIDIAEIAKAVREIIPSDLPKSSRPAPLAIAARPAKRSYPLFFRSSNELIKVGWSSTSKSEYQHKAPYEVLMSFVAAVEKRRKESNAEFAMEEFLPLKIASSSVVPDYQVYLCLAWLRSLGLVKKNGRSGYVTSSKKAIAAAVESGWSQLAANV